MTYTYVSSGLMIRNKEENSHKGVVCINFTQHKQQKWTTFCETMSHFHMHSYKKVLKVLNVIFLKLAFSLLKPIPHPNSIGLRSCPLLRSSDLSKYRCLGICFLPSSLDAHGLEAADTLWGLRI